MRILDLFCCAGGAGKGYSDAGFEVVGVDIDDQPRYPFEFHRGDALEFVREHGHEFDAIHASPPCQAYSRTKSLHSNVHPELVEPTREALIESGKPWVIENVVGAPLIDPIRLSGQHFNMVAPDVDGVPVKLIRHRLFESNIPLTVPESFTPNRDIATASVFGSGGGYTPSHRDDPKNGRGYVPHVSVIKELTGIGWMIKRELSQSIPPVFTEWVGRQLIEHIVSGER